MRIALLPSSRTRVRAIESSAEHSRRSIWFDERTFQPETKAASKSARVSSIAPIEVHIAAETAAANVLIRKRSFELAQRCANAPEQPA